MDSNAYDASIHVELRVKGNIMFYGYSGLNVGSGRLSYCLFRFSEMQVYLPLKGPNFAINALRRHKAYYLPIPLAHATDFYDFSPSRTQLFTSRTRAPRQEEGASCRRQATPLPKANLN
jgi:hypothetical protein